MQTINRLKNQLIRSHKLPLLVFCIFLVSGCAPKINYMNLSRALATRDCSGAKKIIDPDAYGSKSRLLYHMDSGIMHMQCGNYGKAIESFGKASEIGDDLWTESISSQAISLVTNDLALPYAGEDFERVMLPLFSGLCYMQLNQYDEALVDFRRLDIMLGEMNSRYESKNVYKEDALARYLGGALYENLGKYDDAFIDYYKAFKIYVDYKRDYGLKIPDFAAQDLISAAKKTGRMNEAMELMGKDYYDSVKSLDISGKGKVIFISFAGSSPAKHDDRIVIPTGVGPITIAFPVMLPSFVKCRPSGLLIQTPDKTLSARFETAEDIKSIAMKNLEDRKARYIAKALLRATAKQVLIHQIGTRSTDHEGTRNLLKFSLNILNLFLEQADTRSWRTLPGEILVSRFYLPEGSYSIKTNGCRTLADYERQIEVKNGQTTFVVNETAVSGL